MVTAPDCMKLGWRFFHVDVLKKNGSYGLKVTALHDDKAMEVLAVKPDSAMEDFNKRTAVVFPPDVIVEGDQIAHVNGENRVERFVEIFEKADRIFMVVRRRCWFVDGQPLLDFQRLC